MKTTLRQKLIKMRNNLTDRDKKSEKIAEKLLNCDFYKSAQTVMVYMSFGSEVDTIALIEKMLNDGKTLCAPVCAEKGVMTAKKFTALSELKAGAYGILEPRGENAEKIDLIIVPGVGFTENLHRIGYGAGYYDRFLEGFSAVTCGFFYDAQRCDFKAEEHDKPLNYIITETKILKRA